MILKFGLLVLLLIQESTFAAKRQLSLSVVETASVGQNLRQLRIRSLQMFHSKVQSPLSGEFGGPVTSLAGDCAWDHERKECSLSISGMRKLLEESDTGLAEILVERFECLEQEDKWSCNKRMKCAWNKEEHECQYEDWLRGHEDSPCAKAAPLLFDYHEAIAQCRKQDYKTFCETKRQCEWSSEHDSCDADRYLVYFGIKSFENKVHQISDSIYDALEAEYTALQSADNFTWQSLLDYKPRGIDCPSGIEPVVCKLVVSLWSVLIRRSFYCPGKYAAAASDCRADALCLWNTTLAECKSDEDLAEHAADRSAKRVLFRSMPGGMEKKVFKASLECISVVEEGNCHGQCIWNPTTSECQVKYIYRGAFYTKPGKSSTDSLCKYLAVNGFSGCQDRLTPAKCNQTEICTWKAEDKCEPKGEYYISKAAELDPALMEKYFQVKWRCSRHTTHRECVKDQDFSTINESLTWAS